MNDIKDMLTLMANVQNAAVCSPKWRLKGIAFNEVGAPPTFVWESKVDKNTELQIKPEITTDGYNFVVLESSIQGETEIAKFNAKSRIRKPLSVFKIAYDFMSDLITEDTEDTEDGREENKGTTDINI